MRALRQRHVKRLYDQVGRLRPPSALTIRTGPVHYRCLTVCSSGTTGSTGVIFIPSHLPPVWSPRLCCRDGKERVGIS